MDIRDFLNQISVEQLVTKGVLRGETRLLNNGSIVPLIDLMNDQGVTRLQAPDREWFLTSDGQFHNPLPTETKSGLVEDLVNRGNVFNEQNNTINPHYVRHARRELIPSEQDTYQLNEDPDALKFGLERDLQRALRSNIEQLERGLKIIDEGVERSVEAGRIDITAEDGNGCLVFIELKAGRAEPASIGQLLSYMGSVNDDPSRPLRGILVANDFHPRVVLAAKAVSNVSLKAYSFQFSFSER